MTRPDWPGRRGLILVIAGAAPGEALLGLPGREVPVTATASPAARSLHLLTVGRAARPLPLDPAAAAAPGELDRVPRGMSDACRSPTAGPIVGGVIVVAILVALLAVALTADRIAVVCARHRVARQIEDRGFLAKPHVTIAGFPFLTQVAARRLNKVVIRADGMKLGQVEARHLDLLLLGIRGSSSGNGRTASRLSGTALVGFAGLARITGMPGLTVSADGPDRVKITVGLGLVTGTAAARVTRAAGGGGIRITVISAGGIPVAALGALRDITVPLPVRPPGMTIHSVSVTGQGVLVHIAGQNVSFGS